MPQKDSIAEDHQDLDGKHRQRIHLRLRSELGVRASETKADKESQPPVKMRSKGKDAARRSKGKAADQPHLSKKALKAAKERKEIEREFRDAEAEIDKEERAITVSSVFLVLEIMD